MVGEQPRDYLTVGTPDFNKSLSGACMFRVE